MFERHFGLRENPFHSGHQMKFLYPSREHQEARAHLRYGIENREPFVLITGEVGTGKTTALYDALAEWGPRVSVALVTNSALTRQELLEEIALRFGMPMPSGTTKPQALAQLERHLLAVRARGEHAVLLMDEAQNLAPELLEEIRLLSNLEAQGERLVQIFLVGQPELEAKLADPTLRQLRQRIAVHYRLNPLSPEETAGYIHHRIAVAGGNPWQAFPPEACREVYRVTHGIPREINTVATQAMIAAFGDGAPGVTPDHVRSVALEGDFRSVLGAPAKLPDGPAPMPPASAPEPTPVAPSPLEDAPAAGTPAWTPPDLVRGGMTPIAHEEPATAPPPAPVPPAAPEPIAPAVAAAAAAAAAPLATPLAPPPDPKPAPRVDRIERRELDAWSLAARDLMEARRKTAAAMGEPEPAPYEPPPAYEPPPPVAPAPAPRDVAPEPVAPAPPKPAGEPERFPSLAEIAERSASARPDAADLSGLPPRLRQKIEDDIAREEARSKSGAVPAILGAVALVAVLVGTVLAQRFQVIDLPFLRGLVPTAKSHAPVEPQAASTPAPAATTPSPATATPESSATPTPTPAAATTPAATSTPVTTPAQPVAAVTTTTAPPKPAPATTTPAPAKPAATTPVASAPPKPAATSPTFGVGVASYLERERADQERDRLAGLTHLPAVVLPYSSAGTQMFRVVLGSYPSRDAADIASTTLMTRYSVREATPVQLSKGN